MSFYGDMAPKGLTFLQFDKIYPTKTAMDNAIGGNKDDGVFVGRFVVVNYHYKDNEESSDYATRQRKDGGDYHAIVYQKILKKGNPTYLEIIDLKGNIPQVLFNGVNPNTQNEYVKKDEERSTLASPVFNIKKPWEICPVIGLNQEVNQSGNNNTITIKSVYKDGDTWKVVDDDNVKATHKQFIFNIGNLAAADSIVTGMASLFPNSDNLPGLVYAQKGTNTATSLSVAKIDTTLNYSNNTLKVNKITESNISGTISSSKLATGDTTGAVAANNIRKGAVTNSKLATKNDTTNGAAVGTDNIRIGAVTSAELAKKVKSDASKIAAVATDNIQDGAVTSVELSSKTSSNRDKAAVGTSNIKDGAVTSEEIQENTIKYIFEDVEILVPKQGTNETECKTNINNTNSYNGFSFIWNLVSEIENSSKESYYGLDKDLTKGFLKEKGCKVICDLELEVEDKDNDTNFENKFLPDVTFSYDISISDIFLPEVRTLRYNNKNYLRFYLTKFPSAEEEIIIKIPLIVLWRLNI